MTTTTGNTHARRMVKKEPASHVLLHDGQGQLTLGRLRPWHRVLARCAAGRLDQELAAGVSPETSTVLAARAAQLTSMKVRRELATSLERILAAASCPADATIISARPVRLPLARTRIHRSAGPLAALADRLVAPGPVPAQAVAMVGRLLTDGTGPLYRQASDEDLGDILEEVARTLSHPAGLSGHYG
jgi:hypothetical protein